MIKRIVGGTITAGLLELTPLAVSAAASATDSLTTPTVASPCKAVYSGYAAASTYEDNHTPSESAPFAVSVSER